jgi:aspartyl/asparaginyl beta-hydroxylase (cupin superfamily)
LRQWQRIANKKLEVALEVVLILNEKTASSAGFPRNFPSLWQMRNDIAELHAESVK